MKATVSIMRQGCLPPSFMLSMVCKVFTRAVSLVRQGNAIVEIEQTILI